MDRRKFVTASSLAGAAGLLTACGRTPAGGDCVDSATAADQETFEWKMVTTWPRDFPGLGTAVNNLADMTDRMSGGRLKIKVYGGNELVPPFETFDAVSRGTAEMGHGAAYYWKGKVPSTQFFAGTPFGLTGHELHGWYYYGGGMDLYREAYEPFGIIPFPAGNSGTQMGGWFNKEINSLADLQGLKMRIPGMGGEVLRRAGGTPVTIPGAELFTALEGGTIDAAEWVGPYNDLAFGLFRAARYYYYPGWQEPGSGLECIVNADAFATLPADLQAIVEVACQAITTDMYAEFEARNGEALNSLVEEHGVELRAFPADVLAALKGFTLEALEDLAASDELSGRVYDSMKSYQDMVSRWTTIGEQAYLEHR
jgi:TRAP-type mannitol/chloroaromatic compound transport system substrate-binding protein